MFVTENENAFWALVFQADEVELVGINGESLAEGLSCS